MKMEIQAEAIGDLLRVLGASSEGARTCESAIALLKVDPLASVYRSALDESLYELVENGRLTMSGLETLERTLETVQSVNKLLERISRLYRVMGRESERALVNDFRRVLQRCMQWA